MKVSPRKALVIGVAALVPLIFLVHRVERATHTDTQVKQPELGWTDVESGVAIAQRDGRPVMLAGYVDDDGECKTMDRLVYGDWTVASLVRERFVPVRLNARSDALRHVGGRVVRESDYARELGVAHYPTTVFLAPAGNVMRTEEGVPDVVQFRSILRTITAPK